MMMFFLHAFLSLFIWPVLGNKRRRLGPRLFNECILEPLIPKVCMFCHDKLEARHVFLRELQQQHEQSANRRKISVCFCFLN